MPAIEKCKLIKSCATTSFVNCGDVRVGTINYPGTGQQENKNHKYHALFKDDNETSGSRDLGHFMDAYQAFDAIEEAHIVKTMAAYVIHRHTQMSRE